MAEIDNIIDGVVHSLYYIKTAILRNNKDAQIHLKIENVCDGKKTVAIEKGELKGAKANILAQIKAYAPEKIIITVFDEKKSYPPKVIDFTKIETQPAVEIPQVQQAVQQPQQMQFDAAAINGLVEQKFNEKERERELLELKKEVLELKKDIDDKDKIIDVYEAKISKNNQLKLYAGLLKESGFAGFASKLESLAGIEEDEQPDNNTSTEQQLATTPEPGAEERAGYLGNLHPLIETLNLNAVKRIWFVVDTMISDQELNFENIEINLFKNKLNNFITQLKTN
ncbi:MAG: hypothetical protein WC707_06975 [Candidatus Babeliaceae bacterium]|jgi:hypothetical protein